MEYKEFKAKSVDEAVTAATVELGVTSSELDYEIIEKGSSGFLGILCICGERLPYRMNSPVSFVFINLVSYLTK